jgi:hypothetical protein
MTRINWLPAALVIVIAAWPVGAGQLRDSSTRHYSIHSNLDPDLTADLGQRLDAMYEEYDHRLALFRTSASLPRLEVFLFSTQREYLSFTGNRMQNSGGLFLPGKNLLAAFLGDQGRDQLRRTLQHEAFHQFAYNAIAPDLPVWLNEGLAQYFEEGLWNGDGFLLGEVPPRRIRQLQADLKSDRLVNFTTLLNMTGPQWAGRLAARQADGVTQYNQSWAMVHFLVMEQGRDGKFLYRSHLLEMLRLLHTSANGSEAFRLAFGNNIEGFHDRFVQYARNLQATPEATLIENQEVLADLLVDLDRDHHRFDDIASLRRFVSKGRLRLHYSRGDIAWDTEPGMTNCFASLDGSPFAPDDQYFSPRSGAPLPDVVCRCAGKLLLRTRFHDAKSGSIDHELLIEPLRVSASVSKESRE